MIVTKSPKQEWGPVVQHQADMHRRDRRYPGELKEGHAKTGWGKLAQKSIVTCLRSDCRSMAELRIEPQVPRVTGRSMSTLLLKARGYPLPFLYLPTVRK